MSISGSGNMVNQQQMKSPRMDRAESVKSLSVSLSNINRNRKSFEATNSALKTNMHYKKPAMIRNQALLKNPSQQHNQAQKHVNHLFISLKDELIEHFDYQAVSNDVWTYLKAWYDCDFPILRYVKRDLVNHEQLYLEVYPEKRITNDFNFAANVSQPTDQQQSEPTPAKFQASTSNEQNQTEENKHSLGFGSLQKTSRPWGSKRLGAFQ